MSYKILFDSLQEIEKVSLDEESSTKFAFNIFSILRKSDDEVGLHSKFLAEMLNPYGSHAIPAFQKLFIDEVINTAVDSQEWQNKKLDSSIVYSCRTEMFIRGFGRVDIVLFSSENIIVIENKINAEDQPKQLQRYFEACINLGYSSSKIYILYLNKSGVPITNHGKGNLRDEQFGRVNYKEDIIQWLDLCASEVKIYPHIEQNILQYKRLVSVLTGDNKSAKMKKSHIDLLYQDDNFKLAYELSQSFDGLQIDLQKNVWKELLIAFEQKGYSFQFCDKNLTSCDENKLVKNYYKSESRKNRFYGIQYEIDILEDYKIHCFIQLNHNLYYGITVSYNGKRIPYPDKLNKLAEKIASNYPVIEPDSKVRQSNEHWFLSVNILPSERVNFKEVSSIYKLIKQESRVNWVQATVDEVISFITEVKNYGYN